MGDRSGGREVKGASLKKSKKNPGSVAARGMKKKPEVAAGPTTSLAPPRPAVAGLHFDCGAALLSRQFDRDRDRVLQRARMEGSVEAVVLWFSDVEKQNLLADICKEHWGMCYNVVGVHPDNIQNTNKRSHEAWLVKVEELARRPECVGVLSGFNMQRELATHFAQETLLKASCAMAERLLLPLVLHIAGDGASLDKAIELLRGEGWAADAEDGSGGGSGGSGGGSSSRRVVLHDVVTACAGDEAKVDAAVRAGFHCAVSAAGLAEADEVLQAKAKAAVRRIPQTQLLVCSDSPWRTPQNLSDPYLRTLRNEPSNLPSVVAAVAEALGADAVALAATLKDNATRVFGMEFLSDDAAAAAAAVGPGAAASGDVNGKKDVGKKPAAHGEANGTGGKDVAANGKAAAHEDDGNEDEEDDDEEDDDEGDEEVAGAAAALGAARLGVAEANQSEPYYSCQKCRTALFAQARVLAHGLGAARTVFKVGDEGLCSAAVFLAHTGAAGPVPAGSSSGAGKGGKGKKSPDDLPASAGAGAGAADGCGYAVIGTNVECGHCGTKLGRFSAGESTCPCGAVVPGPAVRITAAKVDYVDGSMDAYQLAERARQEAAERDLLGDDDEDDDRPGRTRNKKKKIRSENRGNFSSFRNKSFVPNASRVAKKNEALRGKGGDGDGDDDEEDDEDDDEEEEDDDEGPPEKAGNHGALANGAKQGNKPTAAVAKKSAPQSAFGALNDDDEDDDDDEEEEEVDVKRPAQPVQPKGR